MGRVRAIVVVAMLSVGVVGCGSGDSTSAVDTSQGTAVAPTSAERDHELAVVLCDSLRAKTNRLVDVVNDSVTKIYDSSEAERSQRIRDGFAEAGTVLDDWADSLTDLDLPDVPEAEQLRAELIESIPGGHEELDEEIVPFEGPMSTIPDGEVRGAVGVWQNTIEKVMSVTEPRIERYERVELKRAFLDEPTCRHVVQPFRLDD